jgi:hypothetical protein
MRWASRMEQDKSAIAYTPIDCVFDFCSHQWLHLGSLGEVAHTHKSLVKTRAFRIDLHFARADA